MVRDAHEGHWEFPGGRIDVGEESLPPTDVLRREMREELGAGLAYEILRPIHAWVIPYLAPRLGEHAFAVGYLCGYRSGDIVLSSEHDAFQWVDRDGWKDLRLVVGYDRVLEACWEELPDLS